MTECITTKIDRMYIYHCVCVSLSCLVRRTTRRRISTWVQHHDVGHETLIDLYHGNLPMPYVLTSRPNCSSTYIRCLRFRLLDKNLPTGRTLRNTMTVICRTPVPDVVQVEQFSDRRDQPITHADRICHGRYVRQSLASLKLLEHARRFICSNGKGGTPESEYRSPLRSA